MAVIDDRGHQEVMMFEHNGVDTNANSRLCRPLRVGLQMNSTGYHPAVLRPDTAELWVELTSGPTATDRPMVRLRAADLRDAARKVEAMRGTDSSIFIEVEVLVDPDARCALRALARLDGEVLQTSTLRYVGTPHGLAGLITDIHALGIADGVALLPLTKPGSAEHVLAGLLEPLAALGFQMSSESIDAARRFLTRAVA